MTKGGGESSLLLLQYQGCFPERANPITSKYNTSLSVLAKPRGLDQAQITVGHSRCISSNQGS